MIAFVLAGVLIRGLAESPHRSRRKIGESEAREREAHEKLRVMLASVGDAVIATDARGNVTFLNSGGPVAHRMERRGGRRTAAVEGLQRRQRADPRAGRQSRPSRHAKRQGRRAVQPHRADRERRNRKGDRRQRIADPGRDGGIVGAVLVFRDISERRRADDRFRLALEGSPSATIMVDQEGRIALVNGQTERLFGYRRDELVGPPVELLLPERFRGSHPEHRAAFAAAPRMRPMGSGRDLYGLRKDGTEVPIEVGLNPLEIGGEAFVLSSIVDLTERKRVEEVRNEADRRKDEFIATLAHELRNPLAPLRNGVDILRNAKLDARFRQARDMMERQVQLMVRLVDDLLDVSRITRNKMRLQKQPTDLATLVSLATEISRPVIDRHRHRLTVSLPPETIRLQADPGRLAQAIANLLINAAKFSGEGNDIELLVTREGGQVALRVRDHGIGIAADVLPRIFDMFSQAEDSLPQAEGGLGIGLTLVQALVEMHDGSVQAFSDGPGKGSEFVVRLPVLPEQQPGARPAMLPEKPSPARVSPGPPRRVLLVDDNEDAVLSLGMILEMEVHHVRSAHDACSALEAARTHAPDVVRLDIGLPGGSGYEVARQMPALPGLKNVVVVAVTGYGRGCVETASSLACNSALRSFQHWGKRRRDETTVTRPVVASPLSSSLCPVG